MTHDLIVIGGGPAGLSAAAAAAGLGARVTVLDEGDALGGRLPSQLHEEQDRPGHWHNGQDEARRLIAAATVARVEFRHRTSAWGLFPGWKVLATGEGGGELEAPCLVIATGASQVPVPIPGWTLPGVIAAGAVQVLVNVHRIRPGHRAVIVGVDPLGLVAAQYLALAGVEVAGIMLPPQGPAIGKRHSPVAVMDQLLRLSSSAPSALLQVAGRLGKLGGPRLAAQFFPIQGVKVWDAPLMLRSGITRIVGREQVEGVEVASLSVDGQVTGKERTFVPADTVVLAGGLSPLAELASSLECEMAYIPELGGLVPLHGPDLETTQPGVFVAGSATGVEGAAVAAAQGRLAGLAAARRLGLLPPLEAEELLSRGRDAVKAARATAPIQFHPNITAGRERVAHLWAGLERAAATR